MRSSGNNGTRDERLCFYSPLMGGRLHFLHFETRNMMLVVDQLTHAAMNITENIRTVGCTGGGAHKYANAVREELDIELVQLDEMQSLISGMHFALTQIPSECYTYRRESERENEIAQESPDPISPSTSTQQAEQSRKKDVKEYTKKVPLPYEYIASSNPFPYLVVNIGSGVSILKVRAPNDFERVSGSAIGGGTYWGLCRLLTKCGTFENALDLAEKGDASEIDMLVRDIYGGAYDGINLSPTTVASNFGKLVMMDDKSKVRDEDIAIAMLMMITNNIGQVSYLNATLHKCTKIFFVGTFLRHNSISCRRLAFAIDFWSKGSMEALFLEHEGYFGALGTFLHSSFGPNFEDLFSSKKQKSASPAKAKTKNSETDRTNLTEWLANTVKKLPSFQETFVGLNADISGSRIGKSGKRSQSASTSKSRMRTGSAAVDDYRSSSPLLPMLEKESALEKRSMSDINLTDAIEDDFRPSESSPEFYLDSGGQDKRSISASSNIVSENSSRSPASSIRQRSFSDDV
jgi:type II pantothenate kinase